MNSLELESLEKAIRQFEKGVMEAEQNPHSELMRDGVIKRFHYTITQAWNYLQLRTNTSLQSPTNLIQESVQKNLIKHPERWLNYHHARTQIPNIYEQEIAEEVYAQAVKFLPDVKGFLGTLHSAV